MQVSLATPPPSSLKEVWPERTPPPARCQNLFRPALEVPSTPAATRARGCPPAGAHSLGAASRACAVPTPAARASPAHSPYPELASRSRFAGSAQGVRLAMDPAASTPETAPPLPPGQWQGAGSRAPRAARRGSLAALVFRPLRRAPHVPIPVLARGPGGGGARELIQRRSGALVFKLCFFTCK